MRTEVLVVGGGLGGVSAALTAARLGAKVVLTEELDWLGGQLTSQGVPLDEHSWIETFSASASYAEFRRRLRDYYRAHNDLSAEARRDGRLNPGMGNVGTLCCEPRVAVHVIDDMLAPFESASQIRVRVDARRDARARR
jgi:NADPH-dependent 2,4-dienoyl-CoA reductase/sulfur reductase-like enzyme